MKFQKVDQNFSILNASRDKVFKRSVKLDLIYFQNKPRTFQVGAGDRLQNAKSNMLKGCFYQSSEKRYTAKNSFDLRDFSHLKMSKTKTNHF